MSSDSIDKFIQHPVVAMNCMTFYFQKKLPTYEEFLILFEQLNEIAQQCGLLDDPNREKKEIYNELISHPKITSFLSN